MGPEGEDAEQFGINSMVGVLIISAVLLGISILLVVVRLVCHHIKARRGKAEEPDSKDEEAADKEGPDEKHAQKADQFAKKEDIQEIKMLLKDMQTTLDSHANTKCVSV